MIRTFLLVFALAQAQTPSQIVDQIGGLLQQLKTALATTRVTTGPELTAALGSHQPFIALAAGNYSGNFKIEGPVVLSGPREAILTPADPLQLVLSVLADDVTATGFTVKCGAPDRECVSVGTATATTVAAQPHRVTLDGLSVEAGPTGGHRGIALHGSDITVRNSCVTGFYEVGRDSQAIWIHNGPGPYTVEGNYLEASGENVLTGGSPFAISSVVPSDITIRANTITKPDTWRTNGSTVKNAVEIKAGRRVLIADNVIDGDWKSGQDGTPILLTVRNQDGSSPWVVVDEVTIRGNTTKNCREGFAISILGFDNNFPSQQTLTVTIEHNLFTDSPGGFRIGNGVAGTLTIRNNTLPAITTNFLSAYDSRTVPVLSPLTFTANVVKSGSYGITAACCAVGTATLNGAFRLVAFTDNVIGKSAERGIPYPTGNTLVEPGAFAALLNPTFKLLTGTAGY